MKFLFIFFWALTIHASEKSVVGHWFFYKKVYQGKEIPEGPSANLRLHFEFSSDGVSHLYWWHEGEKDFCSRKGEYRIEADTIVDKVVWVDPKNSSECSSDADMKLGRVTKTPYFFLGDDLGIRFHIGDENLDYIWKRIEVNQ